MIKLYFIPNYGNEEVIREVMKKHHIKVVGKSYASGFMGCDTPNILNIDTTEEIIIPIIKSNKFPDEIWDIRASQL